MIKDLSPLHPELDFCQLNQMVLIHLTSEQFSHDEPPEVTGLDRPEVLHPLLVATRWPQYMK